MKKYIKKANMLASKIEAEYNKLNLLEYNFFDTYHDDLRIQMDCAWQEVDELVEYSENPNKLFGDKTGLECMQYCIGNLSATLEYVTSVIRLQEQTMNLPKSIYG